MPSRKLGIVWLRVRKCKVPRSAGGPRAVNVAFLRSGGCSPEPSLKILKKIGPAGAAPLLHARERERSGRPLGKAGSPKEIGASRAANDRSLRELWLSNFTPRAIAPGHARKCGITARPRTTVRAEVPGCSLNFGPMGNLGDCVAEVRGTRCRNCPLRWDWFY